MPRPLDQLDDAADHLVDVEPAGVELDRAGCGHRAASARAPCPGRRAGPGRAAPSPHQCRAPPRAGALAPRASREEDLHRRIGGDDRADVAALGDPIALARAARAASARAPRAPPGWWPPSTLPRTPPVPGSPRSRPRRSRSRARRAGCPAPAACSEAAPPCRLRHQPDRPVHRTRVQVGEAERARGSARDRALARPGGPVDGHDHEAKATRRLVPRAGPSVRRSSGRLCADIAQMAST